MRRPQVKGELNRDGWIRLCGGHENIVGNDAPRSSRGNDNADADPTNGDSQRSDEKHGQAVIRIGPTLVSGATAADLKNGSTTESPNPATPISGAIPAAATASACAGDNAVLELDVVVNPPAVTSLECAVALPMAGFSIVAQAEAEFCAGMEWEWLREEDPAVDDGKAGGGGGEEKGDDVGMSGAGVAAAAAAGAGGGGGRGGDAGKHGANGAKKKNKDKGGGGGPQAAGAGGGKATHWALAKQGGGREGRDRGINNEGGNRKWYIAAPPAPALVLPVGFLENVRAATETCRAGWAGAEKLHQEVLTMDVC